MSPAVLEPSGLRPRDSGTGTRRVTLYKYLQIVTKQWMHRFVAVALILSSLLIVCCFIRLVLGHSVSVVPQGLYLVSLTAALVSWRYVWCYIEPLFIQVRSV
jgi:membrane protein CcdC involved in cytochrome C biogenesis